VVVCVCVGVYVKTNERETNRKSKLKQSYEERVKRVTSVDWGLNNSRVMQRVQEKNKERR